MPRVYVLLPVHNRVEITRGFVDCLAAQTFSDYQLVLIDDGSTDGTAEMVRSHIPSTVIVRGTGNWWWAGSLQAGLKWVAASQPSLDDIILMMNDDSMIEADFIEQGMNALNRQRDAMLQATIHSCETRQELDRGKVYDSSRLSFRDPVGSESPNCLTTNGLFVRWADLVKVHWFRPRLLPHYLSDYEFTFSAGKRGVKLLCDPRVKMFWDQHSTGVRSFEGMEVVSFLRLLFSNKCAVNPLHWTAFVLLTCPLQAIPGNLAAVWRGALSRMVRQVLNAMQRKVG